MKTDLAISKSERLYKQLCEAQRIAHIGSWELTLSNNVLTWSDETYRIFGAVPETLELTLEKFFSFVHPQDLQRLKIAQEQFLSKKLPLDIEHRIIRADGETRHVHERAELHYDQNGFPVLTGTVHDITDRIESEEKLRHSQHLLQFASAVAHIGAWEVKLDENRFIWSDETCDILEVAQGTRPSLEEGLSFYAPQSRSRIEKVFNDCITHGIPFDEELQVISAKGRNLWVRAIGQAICSTTGVVLRVRGALQNITEKKQSEEAALKIANRLTNTLESITDAFFALDLEWHFTYLNAQAERLLQRSRNDLIGKNIWDEFKEAVGSTFYEQYHRARQEAHPVLFKQFYTPLGLWLEVRAFPSDDGLAVYFRNVTEECLAQESLRESEERFKIVAKATADTIWDWDLKTDSVWWNESIHASFGFSPEELESDRTSRTNRVHPIDKERILHSVHEFIESADEKWSGQYRFLCKDGSYANVLDRCFAIRDANGKAIRMVGSMTDLTAQKQYEIELARLNRALRLRSACDEIINSVTNEKELLQAVCQLALTTGGYRLAWIGYAENDERRSVKSEAKAGCEEDCKYVANLDISWSADTPLGQGPIGQTIRSGLPLAIDDILASPNFAPWLTAAQKRGFRGVIYLPLRHHACIFGVILFYAHGPLIASADEMKLLQEMADNVAFAIQNIRALQEKRQIQLAVETAQMKVDYLTTHDLLTGLPNYTYIQNRLQEMMLQAGEKGQSIMALMIDIDRFKSVNESFGQNAADYLLKTIAKRLDSIAQGSGAVARLHGDKFLLIHPIHANELMSSSLTHQIRDSIGESIFINGHELFLTCCIGAATCPEDATDPETLIQCADLALYGAKDLGNNSYQFYTSKQNKRIHERLKMAAAIRLALDRCEFVLHYQPQVDLQTGHIVSLEALIRWEHPELGMLSPKDFISVAEETGLIMPIGEWAIRTACAQMREWLNAGLPLLRVAVNLSARQFGDDNLIDLVRSALEESGLAPEHLDLEITESLVMADVEKTISILNGLSKLGVQLSIDDFGTGYSSLAYLRRFPIDTLKIDRSFICEIPDNNSDTAIANAIISMAHSLGMRVIAEGVETEAQCDFLSRNMCDEIQGYLFSKPLPALELEIYFHENRRLPDHLLRLQKPARTLLLVDDEPSILSSLKRQLRQDDYQIITAADGRSGLELLAQHKIDVIVSDQRMPGMTGVEFLRQVKNLYPDTVRIVLSGFTELQSVTDAVNEGAIYKFLTKPWDDRQLRGHVAEAFHKKEMADENRRLNIEVQTANQELASANRQLEELLQYKQQQIQRREVSLDIVREALQYVPLPVIGLDEDLSIVFANTAAMDLFGSNGLMLGCHAGDFLSELSHPLSEGQVEERRLAAIHNTTFDIIIHRMGKGTQSRGSLITFLEHA